MIEEIVMTIVGLVIGLFVLFLIIWAILNDIKKGNYRYIDRRGYERDGYNQLIHRRIAYDIYREGYPEGRYTKRFGEYDIHLIDRNKLNNSPDNLQILTREEHKAKHGI